MKNLTPLESTLVKALTASTLVATISTTLLVYNTVRNILISNAIRDSLEEIREAREPQETQEAPEPLLYPNLKEGDTFPGTGTKIVKDNYSDALLILPGKRTGILQYFPTTGQTYAP
jgi:hypothetical protein